MQWDSNSFRVVASIGGLVLLLCLETIWQARPWKTARWRRLLFYAVLTIVKAVIVILLGISIFSTKTANAEPTRRAVHGFLKWLKTNRDAATGLPFSHVGDKRFEHWSITYDSAVVSLAYLAAGEIQEARKIIDYYIDTPGVWRLNGIIEAFIPGPPIQGQAWSVRTGANLWMGIAGFHLYKATGEKRYLDFAVQIANWSLAMQNKDPEDPNFGGVVLGPGGDAAYPGDQHISYDKNQPSFDTIYATEINIDAYALFHMLYLETKDDRYQKGCHHLLRWLKNVAFHPSSFYLFRGFKDPVVSPDIQSWGVSALGVDILDTFDPGLAERMLKFVADHCLSEVIYQKPDGNEVRVVGVDFISRERASLLKRDPMISPEWTFQFINAYQGLVRDFQNRADLQKVIFYRKKIIELRETILTLAVDIDDTLAYPYATQANALIGHEHRTPAEGNLSAVGSAYAVLALQEFDPLVYP